MEIRLNQSKQSALGRLIGCRGTPSRQFPPWLVLYCRYGYKYGTSTLCVTAAGQTHLHAHAHPDVRSDETCGRVGEIPLSSLPSRSRPEGPKEPGGQGTMGLGRDADMHGMRSCTYHSSSFAFSFSIVVFDCKSSAIVQEGSAGSPDQSITAVSQ